MVRYLYRKEGRARALFLVSLRDPEWLWGTGVPFEVPRSWMGKYTRQVWMERGGWVSVNGEAREGARCEMLDDKGVRVSLKWTLFKFKCGGV